MARVTGSLASVNSVPTEGTVLVRALTLRPGSTFAVTGEPKVAVIKAGAFTIEDVEPGPVQLTIQGNGVTHDIRVDVPDEDEVDFLDLLDDVYDWEPEQISAVKLAAREARKAADEARAIAEYFGDVAEVETLVADAYAQAAAAGEHADRAAGHDQAAAAHADRAEAAQGGAERAEAAAQESASGAEESRSLAGVHATAAGAHASAASESAKAADASATAAAGSAGKAKDEADRATEQARAASTSAGEASTHADRAESVVDSVRWDDDKLTVAGKTSPSLRGPKGDRGEQGESGASTWDAISGKPETYPPEPHTHDMGSIDGLGDELAVVREVVRVVAATRAMVEQVTSPPDTPEPGVLYVIPE